MGISMAYSSIGCFGYLYGRVLDLFSDWLLADRVLVPSVVVGVVGIGHVAGITAHWDRDTSNVAELLV